MYAVATKYLSPNRNSGAFLHENIIKVAFLTLEFMLIYKSGLITLLRYISITM